MEGWEKAHDATPMTMRTIMNRMVLFLNMGDSFVFLMKTFQIPVSILKKPNEDCPALWLLHGVLRRFHP